MPPLGDDLILKDSKDRFVPPESGAAVVMDIHTGEIISLVSLPNYNINIEGRYIVKQYNVLFIVRALSLVVLNTITIRTSSHIGSLIIFSF